MTNILGTGESSGAFDRPWSKLVEMEEQVRRKGFGKGTILGQAGHEIRSVAHYLSSPSNLFIAAGDKAGVLNVGCFDLETGAPANGGTWRPLLALPSRDGASHVIDVLQIADTLHGPRLIIGTRGNGAWILPLDRLIAGDHATPAQLPFSENRAVRRLLFDQRSQTLWAAADTRCLAWDFSSLEVDPVVDVELDARATAFAIDRGEDGDDHFYVATNMSTLHRLRRGSDGRFALAEGEITERNADWNGRASVIEHMIPLSEIVEMDLVPGEWRRRFPHRGVAATTLRHAMVLFEESGALVCDVRRVALHSKILAVAPICLPEWQGIAVATLEKTIRVFRPSGIRQPDDEFDPYCKNAPELRTPRTL
ncbi:MAG TPA: hypothetical protein VFO89_17310, partial [Thermoanaerobaculia bacterium]|nr:hypothetical protein [Thermoanaerobaculia bacterium]